MAEKSLLNKYIEDNIEYCENVVNYWSVKLTADSFDTPEMVESEVNGDHWFFNLETDEEYDSWEEVIEKCTEILNNKIEK